MPNVFASSCLRPFSFPRLASLPLCVSALWMLHRAPLAAPLSVDHQARPPLSVLLPAKFSFRLRGAAPYFVPFCRPFPCRAYSLHAAVSARRHTRRKQAYLRNVAPYLITSVTTFYTHKKKFAFIQKKVCEKLARFKNSYYLCKRKITTKYLTRSLDLLYIYICGKIEKARNWLQPVAGGVKAKRFTCLNPQAVQN